MQYSKTVLLKDGRTCVVRNAAAPDARPVLANFILTHAQTDFLTSHPDEVRCTVEEEAAFLQEKTENPVEIELLAEVDGFVAGTAGIHCVRPCEKVKHRAGFGVSVNRDYWGLGVGRALTEGCIACAKTAGYVQVELEVVSENSRAIALYQSVGFTEYGRNPLAFRSRAGRWQENVLMRLVLEENIRKAEEAMKKAGEP